METDPIGPAPTWYVLFVGEEKRSHWVDWVSPRAFQHVCTFCFDARAARWIVYDVNRGGTAVNALAPDEFDAWIWYMRKRKGARVLEVNRRPARRLPVQIGMWCVVAVRYAIGSRSLALRPVGLWRDLLAEGAQEVFI